MGLTDPDQVAARLEEHLRVLTREIGERSILTPEGLARAASYLEARLEGLGLPTFRETYQFQDLTVANLVARWRSGGPVDRRYVLGAHYDTVPGTVGADDNASAVAVLLETARELLRHGAPPGLEVELACFTLEEPPAYGSRQMGSRVRARAARQAGERIDGMLCLEMVGYVCREAGCQSYPLPLALRGYPRTGDFIGIVGNSRSRRLSRRVRAAFRQAPELPSIRLTVPLNGRVIPEVRLSDHASYWDEGYPAVMITDTSFYRNPHYHLPTDTMETLDLPFMARLVEGLLRFLRDPGS